VRACARAAPLSSFGAGATPFGVAGPEPKPDYTPLSRNSVGEEEASPQWSFDDIDEIGRQLNAAPAKRRCCVLTVPTRRNSLSALRQRCMSRCGSVESVREAQSCSLWEHSTD
jgi:hypothetical protein